MKRALIWVLIVVAGAATAFLLDLAFGIFSPESWPADALVVPRDVATVADALAAAEPGATIVLERQEDPYEGPIRLDVPQLTLIGASAGVVVRGTGGEPALVVAADGITVRGLDLGAESIGVRIEASDCVIEDLSIDETSIGVQLTGVRRSRLRNLQVSAEGTGIELVSSSGNEFEFVSVEGASDAGVRLLQSEANEFRQLTVFGSGVGLLLDQGSTGNRFVTSRIYGGSDTGVAVRSSNDNVFEDLDVSEAEVGLYLAAATGNTIQSAWIDSTLSIGVSLRQAERNALAEIAVSACDGVGIGFDQSSENTLSHCSVGSCGAEAIHLVASDRNLLLGTSISKTPIGLELVESDENRILRNVIEETAHAGILMRSSRENRLLDNEIRGGRLGVALAEASGTVLRRNAVTAQTTAGLALFWCPTGSELAENEVADCATGLLIVDSGDVEVLANGVRDGDVGILLARPRAGVLLEGNRIERNGVGLVQTNVDDAFGEAVTALRIGSPMQTGEVEAPRMSNNAFAGNREEDIVNDLEIPLSAAGNWWGDGTDGTEAARVLGSVMLERSAWIGTVAVGTEDTGIQRILGRVLQFGLERAGYRVIDLIGIGDGERVADALRARDVDLIWWGDEAILEEGERHVISAPAMIGWAALASPGLAERLSAPTLSAVSALAREEDIAIRFAAAETFGAERFAALTAAYELEGATAGVTWARTESEAEAMAKFGAVEIALVDSLEETLSTSGFTVLTDDRGAIESTPVTLVLRSDLLTRYPEMAELLSTLAALLTTETLHGLSGRVRMLDLDPEDVVREFLESQRGTG